MQALALFAIIVVVSASEKQELEAVAVELF